MEPMKEDGLDYEYLEDIRAIPLPELSVQWNFLFFNSSCQKKKPKINKINKRNKKQYLIIVSFFSLRRHFSKLTGSTMGPGWQPLY